MDYDKMIKYLDFEIEKSRKVVAETSEAVDLADMRLHWYHIGVVEALNDVRQRAMLGKRRVEKRANATE